MSPILSFLGVVVGKVLGNSTTNKDTILAAQSRINEQEVAGAPVSILRLWRSFLLWVLSLLFVWEVVGRTIMTTYWPDVLLPPPVLNKEISTILLGAMGLGI